MTTDGVRSRITGGLDQLGSACRDKEACQALAGAAEPEGRAGGRRAERSCLGVQAWGSSEQR